LSAHEDLGREHEIKSSSDRSFGFVFAAFFGIIAVLRFVSTRDTVDIRRWAVGVAAGFFLIALVAPSVLKPLNKLWTKLGLLMGKIMAPIIMGALLYLVVTPIGLLMRLFGKDPLRLKMDPSSKSYWIKRDPPGPAPESMSDQF